MASSFPGMNPYLEQDIVWSSFHHSFCDDIMRAIVPQVHPAYFVKIEEHICVHSEEDDIRIAGRADIAISRAENDLEREGGIAVLDAPMIVQLSDVPYEERYAHIEIFDKQSRSLVTLIELLSPANKRLGEDREKFLAIRRKILGSTVSYVEIDLPRGGPRMPIDGLPKCEYYVVPV